NDAITREQLATVFYRYVQSQGDGFTGDWMFLLPFDDRTKIASWANEAVHWCYMKGIVKGKDGNIFDPQCNATRAEAVVMMQRFCERDK
ncbi:MAG: S-layer homology domain-containing protein, partial [Bacillota bacterium]|nr:S-layer homology domain-containing protein [Bacillota bacterium]